MIDVPEPLIVPDLPKVYHFIAKDMIRMTDLRVIQWRMIAGNDGVVVFQFNHEHKLWSQPVNSSLHPGLTAVRNRDNKAHYTSIPEAEEIGPYIMEHLEYWFGNTVNISIDLEGLKEE